MLLSEIAIFAELGEAELSRILSRSLRLHLRKNQIVYSPEELCNSLCVILEGKLRVAKVLLSGQEQIINYLKAGTLFAEGWVFAGRKYPVHVIAETESEILDVPKNALIEAFKCERFLLAYLKSISEKTINLSNVIDVLSLGTVKKRLANYLLELSIAQSSLIVKLPVSKKQLAQSLGTVREVVSRNFSQLQRAGVIERLAKDTVKIVSVRELERTLFE